MKNFSPKDVEDEIAKLISVSLEEKRIRWAI